MKSESKLKISKNHLIIFVCIFAVLGTVLTIFSFATTNYSLQALIEGESTKPDSKSHISSIADNEASKGRTMTMYSNGTITSPKFVTTDKTIKVVVRARATTCNGKPKIQLRIDGKALGSQRKISKGSYRDYSFNSSIGSGGHSFTIKFDNDKYRPHKCDRNVFIDKVTLYANSPVPGDLTAPSVSVISPAKGSAIKGLAEVTATASDNVAVSKVELYSGTMLLGTDLASPYKFEVDTTKLANGKHTLILMAHDAAGNVGQSTVDVVVDNPIVTGGPSGQLWKPEIGDRFMWLIGKTPNLNSPADIGDASKTYTGAAAPKADIIDIDGFENTKATVDALHAKGKKVVCYISAGTAENWRSDFGAFPASVKGNQMSEWPGEFWLKLDAQSRSVIMPIMETRIKNQCKDKGFDAVEFDNVDGYSQSKSEIGVTITASDQIAYNKLLAASAHAQGMSAALKNDVDQLSQLEPYFDFAINEQCNQYDECGGYETSFIKASKPVFIFEYSLTPSKFCAQNNTAKYDSYRMNLALNGQTRITCR